MRPRDESERVARALSVGATGNLEIPGYQLLGELGVGGMGIVHRARELKTGREVALKQLVPPSDIDLATRRFRREFRAAARLQHAHVARVYDFHAEAPLYYTMELVEGCPLDDALRVDSSDLGDPARIERLRVLTGQILIALDAVHSAELVHRDLKPANILVSQLDGELPLTPGTADRSLYEPLADGWRPFVKLLDFGLAWLGDRSGDITRAGMIVGTVDYVSPEQVVGGEVDARTDLYSLGVILFELLTSQAPFEARDTVSLLLKHAYESPPAVRGVNPTVPVDLDAFVRRLMAKEPADRFPSARAALNELTGGKDSSRSSGSIVSPSRLRLLPSRIVGRAAELTTMRAKIDEVAAGRPRVVLVLGEAGAGKSRLLAELQKMARMRGLAVCASAAHDEHGYAFAPFVPILDALARDPALATESGLSQAAVTLGALVPRWRDHGGERSQEESTGNAEEERWRLFGAVLEVVRRKLSRRPVALVIDDLQWADPASLELFAYLVRSVAIETDERLPLVLAGSLREEDVEPGSSLGRWFESLRRTAGVAVIRPDRLGVVGVESMAASMLGVDSVPDELVEWLHGVSQGVPLIISELVAAATTGGTLAASNGKTRLRRNSSGVLDFPRELPSPVTDLVRHRLSRLDAGERKVAAAAAIVGPEVAFDLLLAATAAGEDELLDRLQALLRQRILVESRDAPDLFLFPSRLIRDVLSSELVDRRRRQIHRRIAEAIESNTHRRPEDVVALAQHLLAAGMKREALPWLRRTIDFHRQRLDSVEALASARRAVGILDECPDEPASTRRELDVAIGELEAVMCNYERAAEVFDRALEAGPGDDALASAALLGLSGVGASRGDYGEALIHARRAKEIATAIADGMLLTRAHTAIGRIAWHYGRPEEALEAFSKALELDRARGDEAGQAKALYNIGYAHFAQGSFSSADGCYEQSLEICRSRGHLSGIALSLEAKAASAQRRALYGDAAAALAEARSIMHRFGDRRGEAYCAVSQGNVAAFQSAWVDALASYDEAEAMFVEFGDVRGVAQCATNRGRVLTSLGSYRLANDALGEALRLSRRVADAAALSYCMYALAELWRDVEDWAEAARLDEVVLAAFRLQGDLYGLGIALAGAGTTALGLGQRARAASLANEALELAERAGMPEVRIRAGIALAGLDKDADAAAAAADDASRRGLRELALLARGAESTLATDRSRARRARVDARSRAEALAVGLESRDAFLSRTPIASLFGDVPSA